MAIAMIRMYSHQRTLITPRTPNQNLPGEMPQTDTGIAKPTRTGSLDFHSTHPAPPGKSAPFVGPSLLRPPIARPKSALYQGRPSRDRTLQTPALAPDSRTGLSAWRVQVIGGSAQPRVVDDGVDF
ncbi:MULTISPECIES: hypothetical protein [unclassified Nonomuraea]|uniref:hypothetical protein n=1 Tax=unclassified Nonomuraea TaxID=2593643 RepID=UPI0033E4C017